jgi:tRNA(Phe) wybutosine-synthesizing methylase Tyw3
MNRIYIFKGKEHAKKMHSKVICHQHRPIEQEEGFRKGQKAY